MKSGGFVYNLHLQGLKLKIPGQYGRNPVFHCNTKKFRQDHTAIQIQKTQPGKSYHTKFNINKSDENW